MLYAEASTSQDAVRVYFTDIGMPFKAGYFAEANGQIAYGVNTSLSSFLFGCAGVLTIFSAIADRGSLSRPMLLFLCQGGIFIFLALDDRFMLHERIGQMANIYSSIILMLAVILNVFVYILLFNLSFFNNKMIIFLSAGVMLTGAMLGVDFFWPLHMPLRLSAEDLLKTWAGFCFLLFAWEASRFRLLGQPQGEPAARLPDWLLPVIPARWHARFNP
jgi:hypothetical protein